MDSSKDNSEVSSAAAAMSRKRWQKTSEEERKSFLEKVRSHIDLTPEERTAIGKTAANARWAKWRAEHPDKAGEGQSGIAESRKRAGRTKKPAGSRKKTKPKP
jgi:hypothetical protein